MKKLFILFFEVIVGAGTVFGQTDTLTILHVNDSHSHLAPIGPRDASLKGTLGGIARIATVVGENRMTEPNLLFLHAGDLFIGDIFFNTYFGVPELEILKGLGLDAMTLGNHEFDLGPSTLTMSLDSAFTSGGFPMLCANLAENDSTPTGLKKYVVPYIIKQFGSHHVGIFGLTTPETNTLSNPSPAIISEDFPTIAQTTIDTLKVHNCDVIICLSHLGYNYDSLLAESTHGINVIIGAHDHYLFTTPHRIINAYSDTVWITQAGSFYQYVGKMKLAVGSGTVQLLNYEIIDVDSSIPEDPTTAAIVDNLIAGIEQTYGPVFSKQIATATADFEEIAPSLMSPGKKDTPIGNLVTDAFRALTGTQIAMEVGGSTQEPLYHGPIVGDDLFRVVGYGFNTDNGLGYRLATFKMTGANIMAGLEFGLASIEQNDENFIQASGMTYTYAPDSLPYHRLTGVKIGGAALDPEAEYSITANEFVPMFLNYLGIGYTDLHIMRDTTEFQVLSDYVAKLGTISPSSTGRITEVRKAGRENLVVPDQFFLGQNYPNPFNPSTMISYQLPVLSHITLKVYDVLGRELVTLVDQVKAPGNYEAKFDGSRFASGIYFYVLHGGGISQTRKMVVLK